MDHTSGEQLRGSWVGDRSTVPINPDDEDTVACQRAKLRKEGRNPLYVMY